MLLNKKGLDIACNGVEVFYIYIHNFPIKMNYFMLNVLKSKEISENQYYISFNVFDKSVSLVQKHKTSMFSKTAKKANPSLVFNTPSLVVYDLQQCQEYLVVRCLEDIAYLDQNQLGYIRIIDFQRIIQTNNECIQQQQLYQLSSIIHNCYHLQELTIKIFYGQNGNELAFHLGECILNTLTLISITVNCNKINNEGIALLTRKIIHCKKLKFLTLDFQNNILDSLSEIGTAILQLENLKYLSLDFDNNLMSYEGINGFGNCMKKLYHYRKYTQFNHQINDNFFICFKIVGISLERLEQNI